MYFGENKEEGTARVAVIRFTDDEFDLYKYIENYEHTYGETTRRFACGGLVAIERNEKGVWINESYISVDDFSDFNDFKVNYKEAKKNFKSLKKRSSDIDPELGEFVYDVYIHNFYGWDTYTVRADTVEIAGNKALKRFENETGDTSCDSIRIYKEKSDELLKEIIFEPAEIEQESETETTDNETKELLPVEQFGRLTGTLYKSLFKAIGLEETHRISFIISNNKVFFNYKGIQYKYYPSQCKIFRKCGRKYQRINWKDFTDNKTPADQKQARGRSPPESFC